MACEAEQDAELAFGERMRDAGAPRRGEEGGGADDGEGARIAHALSKRQLSILFGLFLTVVAVRMLIRAFG